MKNSKHIKSYLEYRCSIYYILKNMYITEPNIETIMEIVQMCKKYKEIDEKTPKSEMEFIEYFKSLNKNIIKKEITDIRAEYARLFWGPKKVVAPPFQSVYISKTMFGESAKLSEKYYKNANLKIETLDNLPADFIGYQLEFMQFLSNKLLQDNNSQIIHFQLAFLQNHLSSWITDFTRDIISDTKLEFFSIIAKFTREFIINDEKTFLSNKL